MVSCSGKYSLLVMNLILVCRIQRLENTWQKGIDLTHLHIYQKICEQYSNRIKGFLSDVSSVHVGCCLSFSHNTMLDCWKEDPQQRPTFTEILSILNKRAGKVSVTLQMAT